MYIVDHPGMTVSSIIGTSIGHKRVKKQIFHDIHTLQKTLPLKLVQFV